MNEDATENEHENNTDHRDRFKIVWMCESDAYVALPRMSVSIDLRTVHSVLRPRWAEREIDRLRYTPVKVTFITHPVDGRPERSDRTEQWPAAVEVAVYSNGNMLLRTDDERCAAAIVAAYGEQILDAAS